MARSRVCVTRLFFRYRLHRKPHFPPGEGYHYSDTNYVLLGFIIEELTGDSLAAAIRTRILEPLGMENTYFEYYEPPAGNGMPVDQYLNTIKVTERINTSYEWAGGGLVSTVSDLARFIQALFAGELVSPSTVATMTDISYTEPYGGDYGLGLSRYDVGDATYYGHGGFFGSLMIFDPAKEITLVANVAQANAPWDPEPLVAEVLRLARGD